MKNYASILATFFLLTCTFRAEGQSSDDESLYNRLKTTFQKEYLSVGSLIQFAGNFQPERNSGGNNGFSIANMRLKISGNLDNGFGYILQTRFDSSPVDPSSLGSV